MSRCCRSITGVLVTHLVALEGSGQIEGLMQHRPVEAQAAELTHIYLGDREGTNLHIR